MVTWLMTPPLHICGHICVSPMRCQGGEVRTGLAGIVFPGCRQSAKNLARNVLLSGNSENSRTKMWPSASFEIVDFAPKTTHQWSSSSTRRGRSYETVQWAVSAFCAPALPIGVVFFAHFDPPVLSGDHKCCPRQQKSPAVRQHHHIVLRFQPDVNPIFVAFDGNPPFDFWPIGGFYDRLGQRMRSQRLRSGSLFSSSFPSDVMCQNVASLPSVRGWRFIPVGIKASRISRTL